MSAVASPAPRYGSTSAVATYSGLSERTVKRLVQRGRLPRLKAGRRTLIRFSDVDSYLSSPVRETVMATIHRPEPAAPPIVPTITPDELTRRNRAAIALLDEWEADGDEEEQRETMAVLREALGKRRVISRRPLFP